MAEFLDLSGERTAAALAHPRRHQRCDAPGRGQRKTVPFDRRIVPGVFLVEQVTVFDEQEGFDQHRRDRSEVAIGPLGELRAIKPLAVAVENAQPRLVLFRIDRKRAFVHEARQTRRPSRRVIHRVAALGQRGDKIRQRAVAQALVVGTALGETD